MDDKDFEIVAKHKSCIITLRNSSEQFENSVHHLEEFIEWTEHLSQSLSEEEGIVEKFESLKNVLQNAMSGIEDANGHIQTIISCIEEDVLFGLYVKPLMDAQKLKP